MRRLSAFGTVSNGSTVPCVDFFEVLREGTLHVCFHDRLWAQADNMTNSLAEVSCWESCILNVRSVILPTS